MIKKIAALAATALLASALAGCGTVGTAVQSTTNWLASPATTQAANNVKIFVNAFACGLSSAAAGAQGVEAIKDTSGKAIVDAKGQLITKVVYASSAAMCQISAAQGGLGGTVLSSTPVAVAPAAVAK